MGVFNTKLVVLEIDIYAFYTFKPGLLGFEKVLDLAFLILDCFLYFEEIWVP
jgi:hypothetical protein